LYYFCITPALIRPGSGLTDNPPRGSGIVLPPGPNTDSTVEPLYRPDYRHTNSNSPSPSSSASSERNRNSYGGSNQNGNNNNGRTGYSSNDEDTDRVYDDLCELLKTRSRPALPQNIGMNWPQQQQQQNVVATATTNGSGSSGSGTVVV
jgi:hypothetical protein